MLRWVNTARIALAAIRGTCTGVDVSSNLHPAEVMMSASLEKKTFAELSLAVWCAHKNVCLVYNMVEKIPPKNG